MFVSQAAWFRLHFVSVRAGKKPKVQLIRVSKQNTLRGKKWKICKMHNRKLDNIIYICRETKKMHMKPACAHTNIVEIVADTQIPAEDKGDVLVIGGSYMQKLAANLRNDTAYNKKRI